MLMGLSAFNKGFFDWFKSQRAHLMFGSLAQPDQIDLKTMFTKNTSLI